MKKLMALLLALVLSLSLAACGSAGDTGDGQQQASDNQTAQDNQEGEKEPVELIVFAAASMTETLTEIGEKYMAEHENVTITFNFDSSGTLKTQIESGAECDIFISAAQKQIDELDISSKTQTPTGLTLYSLIHVSTFLRTRSPLLFPKEIPRA